MMKVFILVIAIRKYCGMTNEFFLWLGTVNLVSSGKAMGIVFYHVLPGLFLFCGMPSLRQDSWAWSIHSER